MTQNGPDPAPAATATTVGNYFVANYPPFAYWQPEQVGAVIALLDLAAPPPTMTPTTPTTPATPLGLYVHIPFCRKRCDFCYFRVYTDNDSQRVHRYIDAVLAELDQYVDRPYLRGRQPQFVYFGGGTPSYLSVDQLRHLFDGLRQRLPWDEVREVTFECEPGTLQDKKIHALRELGVTRLSLGVENFNPEILELNNRAHRAAEIFKAYQTARDAGFPQINIDLIAGMVGETDANWHDTIQQTRELAPESVTIYQMEIPYNTTIYRQMKAGDRTIAPVADWPTKQRWVDEAFAALEQDGYLVGSAYTAKQNADIQFLYRDGLWHGADLLGIGVASFSHLGGIHFQNEHDLDPWFDRIEAGEPPIHRALVLDAEAKLRREFILQLKLGSVPVGYFIDKFGVDPRQHFAAELRRHRADGYLEVDGDRIVLSRGGLLQVDRLLHEFFLAEHRGDRYA